MKHAPTPLIPPQLVEALDRRFPDRCPRIDQSEREIWIDVGSRKVIEFLKAELRRQEQDRIIK